VNPTHIATARLLTEVAPIAFESNLFALKGGTAINLFLREMPRVSVDLDLVFTDHRVLREEALASINKALRVARGRLASHNRTLHEVLFPRPKDVRLAYESACEGITVEPVTLEVLLDTRERLFRELPVALNDNERRSAATSPGHGSHTVQALTESTHTRKEVLHNGHPTDIQHH